MDPDTIPYDPHLPFNSRCNFLPDKTKILLTSLENVGNVNCGSTP